MEEESHFGIKIRKKHFNDKKLLSFIHIIDIVNCGPIIHLWEPKT